MMTRKHYIEAAAIFEDAFFQVDPKDPRSEAQVIRDIRSGFVAMFENDNPNFDRARFIEAASAK
jgi:predicted metal-dependent hydrolase